MLTIDGSRGEGGGQMLRTSLALSLATGTPFRMVRIRARREKPGLRPQHVAAVRAAAAIGAATIAGARVGSTEIEFRPGAVRGGTHCFAIGTAGSVGLVLQTVLPPLLTITSPATVTIEGGTHNPMAPSFDFLARAFLPLVARMGPRIEATIERHGFYPAGGGRVVVTIVPAPRLTPIALTERGKIRRRRARAIVARLPSSIGERELRVVADRLGWQPSELETAVVEDSRGPGNALILDVESDHVTEVFTAVGERRVPAETVAARAVREALDYLAADVPVGPHLADQLLLPLALAGGGTFRTMPLTLHAETNMDVVRRFVDVAFRVSSAGPGVVVDVTRAS